MKKLLFVSLLSISFSGFAQFTGGGSSSGPDQSAPASDTEGPKSYFQMAFGLNKPTGANKLHQNGGLAARLEGGILFHNAALLDNKLKFGLAPSGDLSYFTTSYFETNYNSVTSQNELDRTDEISAIGTFTMSAKLGFIASYEPVDNLYVTAKYNLLGYGLTFANGLSYRFGYSYFNSDFHYSPSWGLQACYALSEKFGFSFGFTNGRGKARFEDDMTNNEFVMPLNGMQWEIGLNFLAR